jgi:hypothetical protein
LTTDCTVTASLVINKYTVTPSASYAVRRVYGCGGSLSGDIYTTGAITRSCWVRASFMKEEDAPMMSR